MEEGTQQETQGPVMVEPGVETPPETAQDEVVIVPVAEAPPQAESSPVEVLEPVKPLSQPVMVAAGNPPRVLTIQVSDTGIQVGVMGQCSVNDLRGAAKALMMGAQQAEAQEAQRQKMIMDAKMGLRPGLVPNLKTV